MYEFDEQIYAKVVDLYIYPSYYNVDICKKNQRQFWVHVGST